MHVLIYRISPVQVLETLSLLHVGVEWEGLHVQDL